MSLDSIRLLYFKQLNELITVTRITKERALSSDDDKLIKDNINLFTKSFLTMACACLESCVKEFANYMSGELDKLLAELRIPDRPIRWRINPGEYEKSKAKNHYGNLEIKLSRKEIDESISGNVHKTKDTFDILGINIASDTAAWGKIKEEIQAIITKRNRIIHHNDSASDLSFDDVVNYINRIMEYVDFIKDACDRSRILQK